MFKENAFYYTSLVTYSNVSLEEMGGLGESLVTLVIPALSFKQEKEGISTVKFCSEKQNLNSHYESSLPGEKHFSEKLLLIVY